MQDHGPDFAYRPDDLARSGLIVTLGHDGLARFERGLVRAEDALRSPDVETAEADGAVEAADEPAPMDGDELGSEHDEGLAPLSERLVMDLTAHRTAGLRAALADAPTIALTAIVHALALQVFYPSHEQTTPLQVRLVRSGLERLAPGVTEGPAGRALAERGEAWVARLPAKAQDLWAALTALPGSEMLDLLAYCAALGLYAVRDPHDRRPGAWAHADVLATALSLDMTGVWSPTAASYFTRVSKARMLEVVSEARDAAEAERIAGFRKADMAEAAERLVEGTGWLPPLLRTAPVATDADAAEPDGGDADAYFTDRALRRRILPPPDRAGSLGGATTGAGGAESVPAGPEAVGPANGSDPTGWTDASDEGGPRQEPELAPPDRAPVVRALETERDDWDEDPADPPEPAGPDPRRVARQAALDPDDGIPL